MTFTSSAGRACLVDWDRPLAVTDVLTLLLTVKRAAATAGNLVVLIVVIREVVPVPDHFLLTCIQGTLPAILDSCEQLAVVIEGSGTERDLLRAAFDTARQGPTRRPRPRLFDSLTAALTHAQSLAPHDVLDLQRHTLRQSLPPNGLRT